MDDFRQQLALAVITTLGQVWAMSSVLSDNPESPTLVIWLALVAFSWRFFRNYRIIARHFDKRADYPTGLLGNRGLMAYFGALLDLLQLACVCTWPTVMIYLTRRSLPSLGSSQGGAIVGQVILCCFLSLGFFLGVLMVEPFSRDMLYTEGGVAMTRFTGRLFFPVTSALPLSPLSPILGTTVSKSSVPLTQKHSQVGRTDRDWGATHSPIGSRQHGSLESGLAPLKQLTQRCAN